MNGIATQSPRGELGGASGEFNVQSSMFKVRNELKH